MDLREAIRTTGSVREFRDESVADALVASVLDDLSSAVDVETEVLLWENLARAGLTVIAVSHRAVAFDRADQIIRLP